MVSVTGRVSGEEWAGLGGILSVVNGRYKRAGPDWSERQGGRGFVYPERLNGGEDLLLVAGEGHAHSQQVSMETERRQNTHTSTKPLPERMNLKAEFVSFSE